MRRKKGFTLIELLVVIAVIALLVSILMPSLQKARWLAMRAVCISNIHSQVLAQHLYAADFGGKFAPRTTLLDPQYVRIDNDNTDPWAAMHLKYLTIPNMFRCPILAREFQSNPFFTNMNYNYNFSGITYGGWGSTASRIFTPYAWLAGFPITVMYSGETAPPNNVDQACSSGAMVVHRLSYTPSLPCLWDMGHGGLCGGIGYDPAVAPLTTFDQPVGYGDGHVTIHDKSQIKKRLKFTLPSYCDTDYYY